MSSTVSNSWFLGANVLSQVCLPFGGLGSGQAAWVSYGATPFSETPRPSPGDKQNEKCGLTSFPRINFQATTFPRP